MFSHFLFFVLGKSPTLAIQTITTPHSTVKSKTLKKSHVKYVKVEGNKRISQDVIANQIPPEALTDDAILNSAYKSLVNLGYFKAVTFQKCEGFILVKVEEHPTINQVAFEGNNKLSDTQLDEIVKKMNIASRKPFPLNETNLYPLIQEIKEEYRKNSVLANISISTEPLSNNRVNVIFNINEAPKMRVKEIKFVGVKNFSQSDLRSAIYTKTYNPLKFLTQDHYFVLERLEYDNKALVEHMKNHGFPHAKVTNSYVQVTPNTQDYILTFYVDEGELYRIGEIKFDAERKDLNIDDVKNKVYIQKGQVYNFSKLRASILSIQEEFSKQGFNTLDFDIDEKRNDDAKTIDITFKITKGKNITIRRINILGNTRTHHDVILDRMKTREGDRLNQIKVMESQRALESTGFFKEVSVEPKMITDNSADLVVKVTEARTSVINFNIGYGTLQGMLGSIGLVDQNLMGTGLSLQSGVSIADKEQNVSFGISNPRFLRRNMRGGVNVLYSRSTFYDERIEQTAGGDVFVDYNITDWIKQDLSLGARFEKIEADKKSNARFGDLKFDDVVNKPNDSEVKEKIKEFFPEVKETGLIKKIKERLEKEPEFKKVIEAKFGQLPDEEKIKRVMIAQKTEHRDRRETLYKDDFGKHSVTEFSHGITVRPPIFPLGFPGALSFRMDNHFAGLIGSVSFMKNQVTANYTQKIGDYFQFAAQISYGAIAKLGNDPLRITDCKVMGGQDFHGFDFAGIGPRDRFNETNVGGQNYYLGKIELSIPMPLVSRDMGVRIGGYTEFGSVHNSKFKDKKSIANEETPALTLLHESDSKSFGATHSIFDENFCRVSVGMYVKLVTPFGPIRFDYAVPVRYPKDDNGNMIDKERRFMVGYAYHF